MDIDLTLLANSADIFDDLLVLEDNCFTLPDGVEDKYSQINPELRRQISLRENHHAAEYLDLRSKWLDDPAYELLDTNPSFVEAIRLFKRKAIITIPYWSIHNDPGKDSPHLSMIRFQN